MVISRSQFSVDFLLFLLNDLSETTRKELDKKTCLVFCVCVAGTFGDFLFCFFALLFSSLLLLQS